jgi:hypothetical protein
MIGFSYFKFRMCEKVGGLGRNSAFSYCFHYYFPLSIFFLPLFSFSIFHFIIYYTTGITIQVIFAVL